MRASSSASPPGSAFLLVVTHISPCSDRLISVHGQEARPWLLLTQAPAGAAAAVALLQAAEDGVLPGRFRLQDSQLGLLRLRRVLLHPLVDLGGAGELLRGVGGGGGAAAAGRPDLLPAVRGHQFDPRGGEAGRNLRRRRRRRCAAV